MRKRIEKGETNHISFGAILVNILRRKTDSKNHKKTNRFPKNMEFAAKGVPTWNQNRCQNLPTINTKTGIEKDHEDHQK